MIREMRFIELQATILSFGLAMSWIAPAHAEGAAPLRQVALIPLSGVEKRIDHLAVDPGGLRLFVSALGNGTLEVIDLKAGKRVRSVRGLNEPQGVAYLPVVHKIVVANAGGNVVAFDDDSFTPSITLEGMDDADNLRFDVVANRLYVGYGDGALGIIDPASMKRLADFKLPGHPESFQLEATGTKIYVNVPRTKEVLVVDKQKGDIVSRIKLGSFAKNYPMALDEAHHRLFVGVRQPPRLLVLDTRTGRRVADAPCVSDTDDLFYDVDRDRIYVVGGEGFIDVLAGGGGKDHKYGRLSRLSTRPDARTGLWSRELQRLFVAAPQRGGHEAAIYVYEPDAKK